MLTASIRASWGTSSDEAVMSRLCTSKLQEMQKLGKPSSFASNMHGGSWITYKLSGSPLRDKIIKPRSRSALRVLSGGPSGPQLASSSEHLSQPHAKAISSQRTTFCILSILAAELVRQHYQLLINMIDCDVLTSRVVKPRWIVANATFRYG